MRAVAVILLCGAAAGCGYHLVGTARTLPEDVSTLFVERFLNQTSFADMDQRVDEALAAALPRVESLLHRAGLEVDLFGPDTVRISALPVDLEPEAARTAVEVADEAIQLLGGNGYMTEYEVERFYRDAKITEIYEGTKEIQKNTIASALIGKLK